VDFQYNRHLFTAESVRDWLEQFQDVLESVKARPRQRMGGIMAFPASPRSGGEVKLNGDSSSASEGKQAAAVAVFEPPTTLAQQTVARIWEDLLGVKRIGVHDNFFELGGHSLLMIQVLGRIRAKFQTNISIRRFFEAPTVAGLAEAIEERLISEINEMSETEAQNLLRLAK
jgi:acyl carrier protein